MKTKPMHTPGPWTVSEHADDAAQGLPAYGILHLAGQYGQVEIIPTRTLAESDARLIAAAPDLLEAAKAMLFEHPYACRTNQPACKAGTCADHKLRAAIAKAEGL